MNDRLLITAMNCVSAAGIGNDAMAEGLTRPAALSTVKDFEFHSFDEPVAALQLPEWDHAAVLGKAGLRTKDRPTKMLLSTIETGLKEVFGDREPEKKPGLSIGTAFGSLQSIGDFLSDSIVNGVNAVNPVLFANTVINSPTGNANIRYGIKSLSATSSGTFNAGLDAIIYAADHIRSGHLDSIVAGGLEEVSYYTMLGFKRTGLLSTTGVSQPFAASAPGVVCGEGCALFLVETDASMRRSNRSAIASIAGYAQTFDPNNGSSGCNPLGEGARAAVKQALDMAGITAENIGFIASSANGTRSCDAMEAKLIADMFPATPVAAYKAKLGEAYGASPALSLAAALLDAQRGRVSGVGTGYDLCSPINLVRDTAALAAEHILVTSFSCDGNCAALVVRMSA